MTEPKSRRIHLIYGVVTGASAVVAGICLMGACLQIYRSGDSPFSRAAVAEHFAPIALPVYLCLALVLGGFLLELVLPSPASKRPPAQQAMLLHRLHALRDVSADPAVQQEIQKEQRGRKVQAAIGWALLAVCSVIFLVYACDPAHFHLSEITPSMIAAMKLLLPCLAVPFTWAVYAAYHAKGSMAREIALLKQLPPRSQPATTADSGKEGKRVNALRFAVLAVGLVVLVVGFALGGTADVLTKAINICTECIGLG